MCSCRTLSCAVLHANPGELQGVRGLSSHARATKPRVTGLAGAFPSGVVNSPPAKLARLVQAYATKGSLSGVRHLDPLRVRGGFACSPIL